MSADDLRLLTILFTGLIGVFLALQIPLFLLLSRRTVMPMIGYIVSLVPLLGLFALIPLTFIGISIWINRSRHHKFAEEIRELLQSNNRSEIVDGLIEYLKQPSSIKAGAAARLIGELRIVEALPNLRATLQHQSEDDPVWEVCAKSIATLEDHTRKPQDPIQPR